MLETRREKIVILGGVPVILILFYLLVGGGGGEDETRVEVRANSPVVAVARPAPVPRPVTLPAPAQTLPPPAPPPPAAPAAAAPLGGITLTGVSGTGGGGSAIISYGGGAQRLVAVGREALPGVTLREVRRDSIILSGPAGPVRLSFGGTLTAAQLAAAGPHTSSATVGQAAGPPARMAEASARTYVRATQPERIGGRVVGYRVRSASDIPLLSRAGLQPGDVLLSVNGNAIDGQERLTMIPAEIAGAPSVDVEFERGGRKMRARVAAQ